jgi:hypothetical protein
MALKLEGEFIYGFSLLLLLLLLYCMRWGKISTYSQPEMSLLVISCGLVPGPVVEAMLYM